MNRFKYSLQFPVLALAMFVFASLVQFPGVAMGNDRKAPEKGAKVERDQKSSAKKGKEKSAPANNGSERRRAESGNRLEAKRNPPVNASKDKAKDKSIATAKTRSNDSSKVAKKPAARTLSTTSQTRESQDRTRKAERSSKLAEQNRLDEKRRTEIARQASIARQHAADESVRDDVQAMIAKDDTSGEDPEVRRVALNALGSHAGTVVVMDPRTGRIYSIVNQAWAISEGFKPCSTIKLVTGLAGLNENVIDPSDTRNISDTNQVDLTKALAYSKNDYFQQVGGQLGFEKMISYARRLGLGEKTGINLPHEFQGRMPVLKSGFALNRMSSHGDDFKVTALQLATLVSAIANGGKLLTPQVTRTRQDESKFKTKVRRSVNIDRNVWQYMIPGMVGAVKYGSATRAKDPDATVVGKTGTCIEPGGMWVGLFTSYAPLANPRLAVVVIARGPDAQNHFPAAVAGRIYRDLNDRFKTSSSTMVASTGRSQPDSERSSTRQSTRPTFASHERLETEIVVHEDEEDATDSSVAVNQPARRSSSDGQTRPRRVLTNDR